MSRIPTIPPPADPATHQAAERQFVDHVQQLLSDDRFVLDTSGKRRTKLLGVAVRRDDRAVELLRLMSSLDRPDRQLQQQMPTGQRLEATYWTRRLLFFRKVASRLRVVCASPVRALITGGAASPMNMSDAQRLLSETPPSLAGEPSTVVLVSTSGFTTEARALAQKTAARTVILAEPNAAGGWSLHGPPAAKDLCELLDPEAQEFKSRRIAAMIDQRQLDLAGSGVAADKLAADAQMPIAVVEAALRSYARERAGLVAKRLGGQFVLYRESGATARPAAGGESMPLIDRIKALFARKGETEKKIAFLSERRTALSQQRDRAYEEVAQLEQKDQELRDQFKSATATLTKRRITGQIVQLRKDVERRQQMIGVLNQQVNVVSTHLHNLELVQQGKIADLPDSEQIAEDAASAEQMLADLEAQSEVAQGVSGPATTAGMTEEEAALFAELEAEAHPQAAAPAVAPPSMAEQPAERAKPLRPPPLPTQAPPAKPARDKSQAEPG